MIHPALAIVGALIVLLFVLLVWPRGQTARDSAIDRYYAMVYGDLSVDDESPDEYPDEYNVGVITNALELVHYRMLMCLYNAAPCPVTLNNFHAIHRMRLEQEGLITRNTPKDNFYYITPSGQRVVEIWLQGHPQE